MVCWHGDGKVRGEGQPRGQQQALGQPRSQQQALAGPAAAAASVASAATAAARRPAAAAAGVSADAPLAARPVGPAGPPTRAARLGPADLVRGQQALGARGLQAGHGRRPRALGLGGGQRPAATISAPSVDQLSSTSCRQVVDQLFCRSFARPAAGQLAYQNFWSTAGQQLLVDTWSTDVVRVTSGQQVEVWLLDEVGESAVAASQAAIDSRPASAGSWRQPPVLHLRWLGGRSASGRRQILYTFQDIAFGQQCLEVLYTVSQPCPTDVDARGWRYNALRWFQ